MHGLEEMLGQEKIGHPVSRLVVHQDGAQQRLFGFDGVRQLAITGVFIAVFNGVEVAGVAGWIHGSDS